MIDATALARHRAVTASASRNAGLYRYQGWRLSKIGPDGSAAMGSLPPALRGNFLTEYEDRRTNTTANSIWRKEVDAIRPMDYEAIINRRLGFKAKNGQPTYVYWNHIPIMRLETSEPEPHIYISAFHVAGRAVPTRAIFAANAVLDYLLVGVRLSVKGVEITRRHEITPWPRTAMKPALYIPVRGRGTGHPFWDAKTFAFASNRPVAFPGGSTYEPMRPFPAGPMIASPTPEQPDELDGLT